MVRAGTRVTTRPARRRVGGRPVEALLAVLVFVLLATIVPALVTDLEWLSILPILTYDALGALHVYMMLRVNRLSFASTGFMAVGGYTMALIALHVTANVVIVAIAAFVVPAIAAVMLGLMVLRLHGTYFVLVSFVFSEIVVLIVTNSDSLLGGSSGLSAVPILSLFGVTFGSGPSLLVISAALAALGAGAVAAVTIRYGRQLSAIEQHESLALTLGLRVPLFTTMCLAVAAGVAGLGGAILVNTIGNAQTNSFDPLLAIEYVAYAVVGGGSWMLGAIGGAFVLGWLAQQLATHSEYADMIYGLVLIIVVLYAKNGIGGVGVAVVRRLKRRVTRTVGDHRSSGPVQRVERPPDTEARQAAGVSPAGSDMAPPRLQVTALTKSFGGVMAVSDVDVSVGPGQVLGVIGPNGAGKTTLVSLIAGTLRASKGNVVLEGRDISRMSPAARCRRGLGRSYQQTAVFAPVTVQENLERARVFSGGGLDSDAIGELAQVVGLGGHMRELAGDLPYGLQKVLGLLMAMATNPRVLLLDEPAAGLESSERPRVDALVKQASSRGCSVLLVEHDMDLVRRLCGRLVVLDGGKILSQGPAERVLAEPAVVTAYLGAADADAVPETQTPDGSGR